MDVVFEEEYLSELFEQGKSKNKKHAYQPQVIKKYIKVVNMLLAANRIEDLFPFNSLNYEKLTNSNRESVRIDGKYRLEFSSRIEGEEPHSITICSLIELSNHYKK